MLSVNDSATSSTVKLGWEESTEDNYFCKLNHDCVLCIFSYLEIRDLLACEKGKLCCFPGKLFLLATSRDIVILL